jgi:hypothetical protein
LKNYKEVYGHLEKYECTRRRGAGLDPSLSRVIFLVVFCAHADDLYGERQWFTGSRGGEFLKCRQACMVSELGTKWCTKVKVDEATDFRIGASNLTEKCITVGVAGRMDGAASSENNVKINPRFKL